MGRYAASTSVPVERSKVEIERTLKNYGVDEFFYGTSARGEGIGFKYKGRVIKMNVPRPHKDEFTTDKQYEQSMRQRWRILLLAIKANLEAVESGVWNFEDVFLAHTCLPSGEPIGRAMKPQIDKWLETGKMPKLLTGITE